MDPVVDRILKKLDYLEITIDDLVNTVHYNACITTIEACIKQWNIDMTDKEYPPLPKLDSIKKQ